MVTTARSRIPRIDLNTLHIEPEALRLVPEAVARKHDLMPISVSNNVLTVAMADAVDLLVMQSLEARTRMRVEVEIAPLEEIRKAIDRNYKSYDEIESQFQPDNVVAKPEEGVKVGDVVDAPAVRALDMLVGEAVKHRASDIHIEPQEGKLRVRYRIDGVLHETVSLPLTAHAPLLSRIKIMANMNIADQRPQDGQFALKVHDREINVRVVTIQTMHGQSAVLRILDRTFTALELTELGFLPGSLGRHKQLLKSPYGMILLTGPTGSGKTTTLYASLNHLDRTKRNIITVEDPVEYRLKDINQIEVNPRAGLTFATGLRSILRLDPDVILVGEIRDAETAEIAVQAALTGHLVLSSVHATDTVGAMFRLMELGVKPFYVASALIGVVAQRMVRRVCPHCHRLIGAPEEAWKAYAKEIGEERKEFNYGVGCNSCSGTGYLGRTGVFEILSVSEEISSLLLSGGSATQIRAQAKTEGTITMWRDGMLKASAGITTPDEVLRAVFCRG
ncbi:MAG: type II/IV secretion system protein [Chloroflexi bacterium]|nr:type II/IV secretion system protein [Chloroflexota bacterium]